MGLLLERTPVWVYDVGVKRCCFYFVSALLMGFDSVNSRCKYMMR